MMVAVGAGILWLGWNGFNGGDPFYAGIDAASAVLNTNIATATALLTWVAFDMLFTREHKPTFLGAINGMICGLVGITPSAGWVDGYGAIIVGVICSAIVWVAWNYLSKVKPFSKVDDALGVVYTHGIAGLLGGLLVGMLADPGMIEYGVAGKTYDAAGVLQRRWLVLHRPRSTSSGSSSSQRLDHHLHGDRQCDPLLHRQVRLQGPAGEGRGARGRRPGHPRRGGLPTGDLRRAGHLALEGLSGHG